MVIIILKALRAIFFLFVMLFVVNKSLIFFRIKTNDYISISIWIYLILFAFFFIFYHQRGK